MSTVEDNDVNPSPSANVAVSLFTSREALELKYQLRYLQSSLTRKVNAAVTKLDQLELGVIELEGIKSDVTNKFNKVTSKQQELLNLAASCLSEQEPNEEFDRLFDEQSNTYDQYNSTVENLLIVLNSKINELSLKENNNSKIESSQPAFVQRPVLPFKLTEITVEKFSGNVTSPLNFFHFTLSFQNALKACGDISDDQKLTFLKTRLSDQPLALIYNLDNFSNAWQLLSDTYLNKEAIVDSIFQDIISEEPVQSIIKIKNLFTKIRFKLSELKSFGINWEDDSCYSLLLSRIIRNKLPPFFLQELGRSTGNYYPHMVQLMTVSFSVIDFFESSAKRNSPPCKKPDKINSDVKKQSNKTINVNPVAKNNVIEKSGDIACAKISNVERKKDSSVRPKQNSNPSEKVQTSKQDIRVTNVLCKFCSENHSSSLCRQYITYPERIAKALENNRCQKCLCGNHVTSDCPGLQFECFHCKSLDHVSPVCPKFVNKTVPR